MKTVRNVFFSLLLLFCNMSSICSQSAYAGKDIKIVAILVVQTLLQVILPSIPEQEQTKLLNTSPQLFWSVAGGQHLMQPSTDTSDMAQASNGNDPLVLLQIAMTRVESQINDGQLDLEHTYPDTDVEELQKVLNRIVPYILESGISKYPDHEQEGVRKLILEKVSNFMAYLQSKIGMG